MFQTYDIISCDALCDHGHMTLYYLRNKRKREIKSNKTKTWVRRLWWSIIYKSTCLEITSLSLWWYHLPIIQAYLPQWPPFLQHTLRQYCNYLGISSSMVEILLFGLVFHDRVTPVSVSTLKPPLGIIEALPLKPQVSPIISVCI